MRNSRLLFAAVALVCAAACTKQPEGNGTTPPEEEYKLLEAPAEVHEGNCFNVEFFFGLDDADYAASHILYYTGKKPQVYMYCGAEHIPGTASKLVRAARLSKTYPFFIQNSATSPKGNEGTGFLTKYSVIDFDGVSGDVFMGGVCINLPLQTTVAQTFYSARISGTDQLEKLAELRHNRLYGDSVLVGEFTGEDPEAVRKYAGSKELGMRFDYFDLGGRIVYTLVQPGFVNRGFSSTNSNYVTVKFEKLY